MSEALPKKRAILEAKVFVLYEDGKITIECHVAILRGSMPLINGMDISQAQQALQSALTPFTKPLMAAS